jgi:hypothetical protein
MFKRSQSSDENDDEKGSRNPGANSALPVSSENSYEVVSFALRASGSTDGFPLTVRLSVLRDEPTEMFKHGGTLQPNHPRSSVSNSGVPHPNGVHATGLIIPGQTLERTDFRVTFTDQVRTVLNRRACESAPSAASRRWGLSNPDTSRVPATSQCPQSASYLSRLASGENPDAPPGAEGRTQTRVE